MIGPVVTIQRPPLLKRIRNRAEVPLQQERLGAGGRDDRGIVTSEADGIVRRASCALCVRIDGLLDLAAARLEESGRTLSHAERPRYLLGG